MKRHIVFLIACMTCIFRLSAQEDIVDKLSVPLSDPGKPAFLELGLLNGSITVTGYEGNTVEIESRVRLKKLDEVSDVEFRVREKIRVRERSSVTEHDIEPEEKSSREGMFKIPVVSSSLEVEEDNNKIEIDTDSHNKTIDITIKVPVRTSMELSTHQNGDIVVENVKGDLELQNHNGNIYCEGVSGSVVANSHNGRIKVVLNQVNEKPMSFSTYNRDIDITFPTAFKANVKIKTVNGDVYSDFDVKRSETPTQQIQEKSHKNGGKYKVRIDRAFYGTINGGGPDVQFNNYNGDILIRKL